MREGLYFFSSGRRRTWASRYSRQRRVVLLRAERFGVGAPVRPGFHAGLPRGPVGYDVVMYADRLARLPVHIGGHGYVFELRSGRQAALHAADEIVQLAVSLLAEIVFEYARLLPAARSASCLASALRRSSEYFFGP